MFHAAGREESMAFTPASEHSKRLNRKRGEIGKKRRRVLPDLPGLLFQLGGSLAAPLIRGQECPGSRPRLFDR
jgi:hypothetical protein